MTNSRQKLAAELISFLEGNPKGKSLSWKRTLQRLNQQHNSIRAWQLGRGGSASTENTGSNGFRLLK
jgi:hypothetical protein